MSISSKQERREHALKILLTPSEYQRLKQDATAGGRNLTMSSFARQRIFKPETERTTTPDNLAVLERNLQASYHALTHARVCLKAPLSADDQEQLMAFIERIIGEIDQSVHP